jgi:citrate lyase subunit beta/citryl-CoA lyase
VKPTRSVLFVPGHKQDWAAKAVAAGTDAVILDLEDSVPNNLKNEARGMVAETIGNLARNHPNLGIYVRINSLESGLAGDDLEAVAIAGCHGFVPPKTYCARDVISLDALTTHFERRNSVTAGSLEFILSLETAQAYADCEQMLAASPRSATLFAGTARAGDVARSIGFEFTTEGLETLYLRSRTVLAVRSAGRNFPLFGVWQDIKDLKGARRFAEQNKGLGFRGMVSIHPSHVEIANEVFTPSDEDVAFYSGMIEAFEKAEALGHGAISYEGMHIDYAHVKTAHEVLSLHRALTTREKA